MCVPERKEFVGEENKQSFMSVAKIIVAYPAPTDPESFDKVYLEEHVPLAIAKLAGKTKIVATQIVGSPQGTPTFYRVAEVYFPSMAALQQCAASAGGQETLAHAAKISTGGPPLIMIAEEETFTL
jgi:uncharacterized protein (TIGR02118 family)